MKKRLLINIFVSVVLLMPFFIFIPTLIFNNNNGITFSEYHNMKLMKYENENIDANDVDVVFLGDSLTEGYNLKRYYSTYNVLNRGIGGDTTFGLEKRLKVSVYDVQPKVVVMLIGGNNLTTMFDNYERILIKLKENLPNSKIIICSLTCFGNDYAIHNKMVMENNIKIKELANKYDYSFVNLFSPLYNTATEAICDEYTKEGVHLTKAGYDVVTNSLKPVIDNLLESNYE